MKRVPVLGMLMCGCLASGTASAEWSGKGQLGIEVKINDTFALRLDYAVRHNTDVLPGTRNSDQIYTAIVVVGFGVAP